MDCTTKMLSTKRSVTFILGVCLLLSVSASTSINLVTYNGNVGHATSYNYPFKHRYDTATDTYRLFADTASAQKLCLTFRRFEMSFNSRFTINVKTSDGVIQYYDYMRDGESVDHPINSPLPDNIWKQPFCVDLAGDTSLTFTFRTQSSTNLSGFYLEYQTTTPQINGPCGAGLFTCYNRECVNDRYICKNEAACTDMSHNTFAHAFCKDSNGAPVQQSGFWANDLDTGDADGIKMDNGWILAEKVLHPFAGPPSDHTGSGKFLHTKFSSTRYDLKMTFSPGKLVQKENCLSFWYYMDGHDPGELLVEWGLSKVWQRTGSYGGKWLQAQANLFCESGLRCDQQVKITASRGSNPDTRISVDDISVMPGLCPFYEADLIKDAWTTDDGCTYINGRLSCSSSSSSSAHTKSWLVSRGKCLVGDVEFDFNTNPGQTVMVFKYPVVDGSEIHLKTIRQSRANQMVQFKIPIELHVSVPVKIGFTTIFNKGRISLENIHVVDNECDNIAIGACQRNQFYCAEGECISDFKVCDGVKDCSDKKGQDEEKCTKCRNSAFLCWNGHCVESHLVCNGVNDCQDNSDEQLCGAKGGSAIGTIVGIVIGVIVAICVSVITVGIFLHKRYCKKPEQQRHAPPQPYTAPAYSDRLSPTAPSLGQN